MQVIKVKELSSKAKNFDGVRFSRIGESQSAGRSALDGSECLRRKAGRRAKGTDSSRVALASHRDPSRRRVCLILGIGPSLEDRM